MTFGQRLRKLRKEHDLSQEELAKILETDRSNVANWETRRQPDYEVVKKIAAFFNVTTDYLLGLVDNKVQSVEMQVKTTDGRVLEGLKIMEELSDEDYQSVLKMLQGLKAKADLEKKLER
jgi:transcriptional regulator with XRE-family HTH domain